MYLLNGDKHSCTGCEACFNVCPRKCIVMEQDEDGFIFPAINRTRCVSCHKCERVCPIENPPIPMGRYTEPAIIAAKLKEEELLLQSASGGAFTAIAKAFIQHDGSYIYGAAFDEKMKVHHICSFKDERLEQIRGSKYVQSQIGYTYLKVKEQLRQGYKVLFSGTPCQVAGLRNVLQNENIENLLCVDLMCHGAPSQKIFDQYIEEQGQKYKHAITSVKFRYKKAGISGNWTTRNILLTTEDKKEHVQTRYQSSFLRAYHPCLINRFSCYECFFSQPSRQGDLTIGDFWGIDRFYPDLCVEHGISIIQVNTRRGEKILESLSDTMHIYPINRKVYEKGFKSSLVKSGGIKTNPQRNDFLRLVREYGITHAVKKTYPFHWDYLKYAAVHVKKNIIRGVR